LETSKHCTDAKKQDLTDMHMQYLWSNVSAQS